MFEKIVIVTRKTRLEELVERFGTRGQAQFYIEHSGASFDEYGQEHNAYHHSLDSVRRSLDLGLKVHVVRRELIPTYLFTGKELIVTLGQDGLVANTAKYVGAQPIIAVNPDPERFDGVLLPISVKQCRLAVEQTLAGRAQVAKVTLAKVALNDGQQLLAFNDFFIGPVSHTSARYRLHYNGKSEQQSSSGIIVCTGAGSTGWMASVFSMVQGFSTNFGGPRIDAPRLHWNSDHLRFVVREPFVSRHSSAEIITGTVSQSERLSVESAMPTGGIIFSDGIEKDFLQFNAGATATISVADHQAVLVRVHSGNKSYSGHHHIRRARGRSAHITG